MSDTANETPWLDARLRGPVADSPRSRDYQRRTDANVARLLADLDPDSGLLRLAEHAGDPADLQGLDSAACLALSRRPEWLAYYDQGRSTTSLIGRMAWCYRQPRSAHYQSGALLRAIRRGLATIAANQAADGSLAFCPINYAQLWASHEMAWRLEPLIYAQVWIRDDLPPDEAAANVAMIRRAAAYLASRPCREANNRGGVWCAVMALAGRWLDDPSYLEAARNVWQAILPRLFVGGQVMEETGPDANYSYTGMSYYYLYRLFADDPSLDPLLSQSLQWFARMRTLGGVPFEGPSSRLRRVRHHKLDDLLPLLERYSTDEPYFSTLADRYLGWLDAADRGDSAGHGCDMRIWAMLEHVPSQTAPAAPPDWFDQVNGEYKTDATLYALWKRRYQIFMTLRAALPLKGIQTWAWGDESPVIHPGDVSASRTIGWGMDSAIVPVSKQAASGVWADRQLSSVEGCDVYSFRQECLWTHILLTESSTVVILAGDFGPREIHWCVNLDVSPSPQIRDGQICFDGMHGRLYYPGAPPELVETDDHCITLKFWREEPVSLFAFSNESLQIGEGGRQDWTVQDESGRYQLALNSGRRQQLNVKKQ